MRFMEKAVSLDVSVEEAVGRLCSVRLTLQEEDILLPEALGRILANDLIAPLPMPPFRRAAMDGYAVRAAETVGATPDRPILLSVVSEARAGSAPLPMLHGVSRSGREIAAARVFTGSPVPAEFDAVIMQEMAKAPGSGRLPQIDRSPLAGQHIAEAGEDVREGELLLAKGTRVGPKELGILASFGMSRVSVRRRLTAAVLPIGSELALPGAPLPPNHIYEANGFMAEARLRQLGADVVRLDPVPDEPETIRRRLEQAWARAELVVTTGGVSVGDYDYAKEAAALAGARPLFTKVRVRPGSPTSAFVRDDRTLIALSGNPSACFAGLELLAVPFARWRMGEARDGSEWLSGSLADPVEKPCPYPRYVRSFAWMEDGRWLIRPQSGDKSGNIAAFAGANALAEVPAGGQGGRRGQTVRWIRLD